MKRLKNNSGATILMALLLTLLATAVGAAVLTAAVSAAHHLRSDREAQQNYLTVSSAAELIRDSINGQTYKRTLTVTREAITDEHGNVTYPVSSNTEVIHPKGIIKAWLDACMENSEGTSDLYAAFRPCSDIITVTVGDTAAGLQQVQAKFSAEPSTITLEGEVLDSSIIRVELSLPSDDEKADNCRMTLTMIGKLRRVGPREVPLEPETGTFKFVTNVTWEPYGAVIKKGIEAEEAGT